MHTPRLRRCGAPELPVTPAAQLCVCVCVCVPAQLKEGMHVWVKDASIAGSDLFTKGHILNINANKVTVETSNNVKTQARHRCQHLCSRRTAAPPSFFTQPAAPLRHRTRTHAIAPPTPQELIIPATECFHICPDGDVPDHCQLMPRSIRAARAASLRRPSSSRACRSAARRASLFQASTRLVRPFRPLLQYSLRHAHGGHTRPHLFSSARDSTGACVRVGAPALVHTPHRLSSALPSRHLPLTGSSRSRRCSRTRAAASPPTRSTPWSATS